MADGANIDRDAAVMISGQRSRDEPQLTVQWARVRGRLQSEVGDVEYRTWLRQMSLGGLDGDEVTVRLPTRFLRDWVRTHYGDRLNALWQAENRRVRRVDIRVGGIVPGEGLAEPMNLAEPVSVAEPANVAEPAGPAPLAAGHSAPDRAASDRVAADRADPRAETAAALDPRFTFDSFVVGKPNEFAYACARRVAEMPASVGFNPLFLYGGVGLGKTHLMHAIAWDLTRGGDASRGGAPVSVAYMSAEKFMYRFIAAIRSQSTMEFKEHLRSVDVVIFL